jgi:murein DD-endopeptidase MepM/ murein hydrolase activator NlpD
VKIPAATASGATAPDPRLREASRAMESMLLKQIVVSSGAFKGGEGAGSGVRADVFAQTLADALSKSGGIGLASMLERSLGGGAGTPGLDPSGAPAPGGGAPRLPIVPVRPARHAPVAAPDPIAMSSPVAGAPTSSPFGIRNDPFTGIPGHHAGIDLAAPEGVPVEASAAGVVVSAGPRGGYGLAVEIDHGSGITTLYGHASQILVQPGDRVEQGAPIAMVGDTGRSTGPHVHFEVRDHGSPLDPRQALSAYRLRAEKTYGGSRVASVRSP